MTPAAPPITHTRQNLSPRKAATVAALVAAGLEELRETGYDQLTVRSVASRAGVTHTTAYSYFASKAHLVAETYWRQLQAIPHPELDPTAPLAARVHHALEGAARILGANPALAQAALSALLTDDLEVTRLRNAIGADLAARVATALGPETSPELADALLLAFSGAMLQAGMGYFDFSGVVQRMTSLAGLLTDGPGATSASAPT